LYEVHEIAGADVHPMALEMADSAIAVANVDQVKVLGVRLVLEVFVDGIAKPELLRNTLLRGHVGLLGEILPLTGVVH
jgi:hypothetical protein